MADDIVGGLFGINPEMYQQQQQQQVFNRAVALQNLDPFQRASVGLQQAGYNLAGALGGALGGVDPQLQRISALNAISKQIDQSSPESMLNGAKLLADAGFQQEAFGLAQYARKANSEIALAQQRMKKGRAAAIPKEVQIAEYTATLRNAIKQLEAGPSSPETDNQIAELQGRLDALPQPKEGAQNADVFKAQRAGQIVNQLAILEGLPAEQQSPEAIRALKTELAILNPKKEVAVSANVQDSAEIGRLVGQLDELSRLPENLENQTKIKQFQAQLKSLVKNTKPSEFGQILQDAGIDPDSQDYKDKMTEFANLKLAEKPETKTEAMKNAIAIAEASPYKKGTPEYNKIYSDKLAEFTGKAEKASPTVGVDREAIAKELYFKPFNSLNQDEIKAVNAEADKRDLAAKKASAASLKVEVPLGEAMTKALGLGEAAVQAKDWGTAGEAYKAAIPMIDKLGQVKSSLSSTFTGAGADAKLAFSKGLAALGVPVDITKISNAEYFNTVSSQLVQAIARVFPGSQSNKELEQLLKSKPNSYQEIPTIVRIIGQIQDEMIASTKTYEKLNALGVKGRSTANPSIIEGQIYTKLRRYRALEAQAASGKPMQQKDIDEAKKLQQELEVN
jgi:hypothetical protein